MRNLLLETLKAKGIKGWNHEKLIILTEDFMQDSDINMIVWDYLSGEEVCGFLIGDKLVAYVHEKLPICFYLIEFDKYKDLNSDILWFVASEDFYKREWYANLDQLREMIPELTWSASVEAVNPDSFSVDDFRFATH